MSCCRNLPRILKIGPDYGKWDGGNSLKKDKAKKKGNNNKKSETEPPSLHRSLQGKMQVTRGVEILGEKIPKTLTEEISKSRDKKPGEPKDKGKEERGRQKSEKDKSCEEKKNGDIKLK